jgi:hypothetical protein
MGIENCTSSAAGTASSSWQLVNAKMPNVISVIILFMGIVFYFSD